MSVNLKKRDVARSMMAMAVVTKTKTLIRNMMVTKREQKKKMSMELTLLEVEMVRFAVE